MDDDQKTDATDATDANDAPDPHDDGRGGHPTGREPESNLSRRRLLRAGAVAGAAVAVGAATGVPGALGQTPGPTPPPTVPVPPGPKRDQNGGRRGRGVQALAGGAAALPPLLPGATVGQRGWASFSTSDFLGFAPRKLYDTYGLVYDEGGSWVETELDLPAGSTLLRVDVFGKLTDENEDVQAWRVFSQIIGTPDDPLVLLSDIETGPGPGVVTGTADFAGAPVPIAPGQIVNVTLELTSPLNLANGVIFQYYPAGQIRFITPTRVYDSRPGSTPPPGPKTKLVPNTARAVDCTFGGAVPAGARAAVINLTAVNPAAAGWITAFRNGIPWPGTSTVNFNGANETAANSSIVELDASGKLAVFANVPTDVVVDVTGFIP